MVPPAAAVGAALLEAAPLEAALLEALEPDVAEVAAEAEADDAAAGVAWLPGAAVGAATDCVPHPAATSPSMAMPSTAARGVLIADPLPSAGTRA
jgi:hypothetical protein